MPARTKRVDLDGNGAGSVHVDPLWWAGGTGFSVAVNSGLDLGGTAIKTFKDMIQVRGEIDVYGGTPNGKAYVYLFDI